MKRNLAKETGYILLALVPYVYLALIYSGLPQTVPTHFGAGGNIDGWSSRASLWLIPASLPLGIYLLFLILPRIDPKQKLRKGSGKFEHIRFILVLFLSGLSCFVLYISKNQSIQHLDKFLFAFMGLFLAALGNFFPSLKANYFIGIRSPWTLENEVVWKKTHQFAGKLWVAGGLLLVVLAFVPYFSHMDLVTLPLILALALIPFFYSYVLWRKLKAQTSQDLTDKKP
jgi:uncharacterized membrane protein